MIKDPNKVFGILYLILMNKKYKKLYLFQLSSFKNLFFKMNFDFS